MRLDLSGKRMRRFIGCSRFKSIEGHNMLHIKYFWNQINTKQCTTDTREEKTLFGQKIKISTSQQGKIMKIVLSRGVVFIFCFFKFVV